MTIHLLLASQSPRRRHLLKLVGLPFSAISANVDESTITDLDPTINVVKTAELKARAIAFQIPSPTQPTIIVAADTIVALDQQMLGKPHDIADAKRMLLALRNRTHEVHTGMVLIDMRDREIITGVHTAVVTMRAYTNKEIDTYLATADSLDKAGAYAIQHPQFNPVSHLQGCYLGVMGISICHLLQMLIQRNISPPTNLTALRHAHPSMTCPLL